MAVLPIPPGTGCAAGWKPEGVIDSGKKCQDTSGRWMVNSLYLDITRSEEDAERIREQAQLLSIYDTVPAESSVLYGSMTAVTALSL